MSSLPDPGGTLLFALAFVLALASCKTPESAAKPGVPADAAADDGGIRVTIGGDASAEDDSPPIDPKAALPWPEQVRLGLWRAAGASFDGLSAAEKDAPETRFARARVALRLGKPREALGLLDRLEDKLPLLRDLIAAGRAEAALVAGPQEAAAAYYAARSDPDDLLVAADAWDKAGDQVKARVACDGVLKVKKRSPAQEEKARAMRMRLVALKSGDAAAADDARWLAIHGLDDAVVHEARRILDKLSPPKPLTADELIERSRTLADARRPDDAVRAIERAASARGKVSAEDQCRARAEAYYKARTRYPDAASAYKKCSALGGKNAAEYAFLSARALSRADRDAEATAAFDKVIHRWPKTTWADQAEFHVARTHFLAGRYRDAATAFDAYAKHWPRGQEKREADRYRALAHLVAHDHKTARKLLEELAGGTRDGVTQARWTNLAALAALRDGDRTHAIARWTDVARNQPLTWPALVARARLASLSAPLPAAMDPAESGPAPETMTVDLPPPADVLHRIGFDRDAEDSLRAREAAIVAKATGRGNEALCAAYAAIDRGKRRYQLSFRIPGSALEKAPGPKNRWAWECAFPRPYKRHVRTQESRQKLPTDLVWAVMRQESAFDPDVVSRARAVGLMQLLPETAATTAKHIGIEHDDSMLTNPEHNIALGARYLRELLDELHENVPLAVAAYNAGPEAIERWKKRAANGETLDVFVEAIPFLETRGYVARVMGNLARYGYLERGEAGVPVVALDLE